MLDFMEASVPEDTVVDSYEVPEMEQATQALIEFVRELDPDYRREPEEDEY